MTYFHISGTKGNYVLFTRDEGGKFPFMSQLFIGSGSRNNVQSWKTEEGARRFVEKNFPDWKYETTAEYKSRHADYKIAAQITK